MGDAYCVILNDWIYWKTALDTIEAWIGLYFDADPEHAPSQHRSTIIGKKCADFRANVLESGRNSFVSLVLLGEGFGVRPSTLSLCLYKRSHVDTSFLKKCPPPLHYMA